MTLQSCDDEVGSSLSVAFYIFCYIILHYNILVSRLLRRCVYSHGVGSGSSALVQLKKVMFHSYSVNLVSRVEACAKLVNND